MFETEQRRLHKICVAVHKQIDPYVLDCVVDVDRYAEHVAHSIVCDVRGYVLGEHKEGKAVTYPKTWWDAFKIQWFPTWALQNWPAKMTSVTIEFDVLYPDFRPAIPKEQHTVVVHLTEPSTELYVGGPDKCDAECTMLEIRHD